MSQAKRKFRRFFFFLMSILMVAFFSVLAFKTVSQFVLVGGQKDSVAAPKKADKNVPKLRRYFAVGVNLTSAKENITKEELQNLAKDGKLTVLAKDKAELGRVLKNDIKKPVTEVPTKMGKEEVAVLRVDDLNPLFKVIKVDGQSLWEDDGYSLFAEVAKAEGEVEFNRQKVVKLTSTGDIILGRTVYKKMTQKGYLSPFSLVSDRLSSADLTFGDLETPLSDSQKPPTTGMSFLAPTKAIEGILASGFDVLGLANNHSTNFGTTAFSDTLTTLKENKIEYVGGGENEAEAKSYKVLNSKGKRIAFVDANSIIGDVAALGSKSGDWHFNLSPWGKRDESQVDEFLNVVKEAKKDSDLTVVMVHWSAEYTHDPSGEMKKLGHELIDAGADLIVGTHPHWTQGVEVYKGKLIAYSLGNFVFDQEWSRETKEGLIMDSYIYKDKVLSVNLTPVLVEDYHRPRILDQKEGAPLMAAVWESSRKINPNF